MKTLENSAEQEAILSRIARLSLDSRAQWGKMSVREMLPHLTDSYVAALGEKAVSSASGLVQRTVIKWLALRVPLRWMKGVPTRPEMKLGTGGTAPGDFEADRRILIVVLRRFCAGLPQPCLPHPVFGPMQAQDWWRWGYLHADHHLRQFGC